MLWLALEASFALRSAQERSWLMVRPIINTEPLPADSQGNRQVGSFDDPSGMKGTLRFARIEERVPLSSLSRVLWNLISRITHR